MFPGNMKARIHDRVLYSPYPNVDIPERSFYALAKEKLLVNPEKLVLVSDVVSLTRSETLAHMERYAVGFRKNGVVPGDRVCIHLDNGVENLVAIYGCILAGATAVLAKTSLTENELRYQAEDSGITQILTDQKYTQKVVNVAEELKIKGLFCMGPASGFVSVSEFLDLDERDFVELPVKNPRDTVLAVCYTSGSTGLPKGCEITHYNYVAAFYTITSYMMWKTSDVLLASPPITYQAGMMFTMVGALAGITCVMVPAMMTPAQTMDSIDKYKVTTAVLFPSHLQAVVRELCRTGRKLPSLRTISTGGSVLLPSVVEAVRKAFGSLEQLSKGYGTTESCGSVTTQPNVGEHGDGRGDGMPATGVTVKVVDVCTREKLGPHQVGEICFQTLSMVRGYYKRPKESAELFDEEGWCKSGDAGYYDEDGCLYFCERLKQMIKCMDDQVVPAELEDLLLREYVAEIAEVSVVGLPHSEYGEAPAAAIVLTEEGKKQDFSTLASRIRTTVATNLAVSKHLYGGVYFVDSLPKTETAKVNRPALARSLMRV
ncbi:luciferin 4-monooxygenase-like [Dermacentor silvarum]|uniref:luciferin 4-monooxygenase-like n=1 Tax=Dermacentor silvarum TaxID=543639 RepID=UPI0021019D0A|nr:luciferin 4-monooxygenase-like [Dermacentor silvarum]